MLQVGILQHHLVVFQLEPTDQSISYLWMAVILAITARAVAQLLDRYVQEALRVVAYF